MKSRRLSLHKELKEVVGSDSVYFQPPSTIQMKYPCIVYNRDFMDEVYANNRTYANRYRYSVTVIDKSPDSEILDKLKERFTLISFDRHYISDNLNHDVFTLYY